MAEKEKGKEESIKLITSNRRAGFDFYIEKRIEAGIELKGSEVKSCRDAKVQLVDAFAMVEKNEIYLHKANIGEYIQSGPYFNHLPTRKRRLLLHRREIATLKDSVEREGYTLIPMKMYFKNGVAKVELGLAKGKNKGDKREASKDREVNRSLGRAVRRSRDDED